MSDFQPGDLSPGRFVNSDAPQIIALARDLTENIAGDTKRAAALFLHVRDTIAYNPYCTSFDPEDYKATATLARGEGFCVQKAVLLCALARAIAIPSRLIFADIKSHRVPQKLLEYMGTNLFVYHGYTALFIDGRWLKATPSFDKKMCKESGVRLVNFDGTADAVLNDTDLAGRAHIEYVRRIGEFQDIPFEEMTKVYRKVYLDENPNRDKIMAFFAKTLGKDEP